MNDFMLLTLGAGIAISMIFSWRTGYGSGGLVSAGVLALLLRSPLSVGACLAASLIVLPVLDFGVKRWGWYGRTRIGCAMILALAVRFVASRFFVPLPWAGFIIPGLIAADMQRQGVFETLSALTSVTILTAFAAELLLQIGDVL
ncbi:MAG: poly-gamma-glutamate biosynthesis protein PgsC/CapC [Pyramidobacter sp.]|nr:poly-gamma-glutamate biosynthesis protein PgsC/CapC [Pyramidobacter sp.]